MNNYTAEELRKYIAYAIEHITDQRTLYLTWARLEQQMLREYRSEATKKTA